MIKLTVTCLNAKSERNPEEVSKHQHEAQSLCNYVPPTKCSQQNIFRKIKVNVIMEMVMFW